VKPSSTLWCVPGLVPLCLTPPHLLEQLPPLKPTSRVIPPSNTAQISLQFSGLRRSIPGQFFCPLLRLSLCFTVDLLDGLVPTNIQSDPYDRRTSPLLFLNPPSSLSVLLSVGEILRHSEDVLGFLSRSIIFSLFFGECHLYFPEPLRLVFPAHPDRSPSLSSSVQAPPSVPPPVFPASVPDLSKVYGSNLRPHAARLAVVLRTPCTFYFSVSSATGDAFFPPSPF